MATAEPSPADADGIELLRFALANSIELCQQSKRNGVNKPGEAEIVRLINLSIEAVQPAILPPDAVSAAFSDLPGISDRSRPNERQSASPQGNLQSAHGYCCEAAVLAWDLLHSGHWSDVPPSTRSLYAAASLLQVACTVHQALSSGCESHSNDCRRPSNTGSQELRGQSDHAPCKDADSPAPLQLLPTLRRCLRSLDLALMLGTPGDRPALLMAVEAVEGWISGIGQGNNERDDAASNDKLQGGHNADGVIIPLSFPPPPSPGCLPVPCVHLPSLTAFYRDYVCYRPPEGSDSNSVGNVYEHTPSSQSDNDGLSPILGRPVIIDGALACWPAMRKWGTGRARVSVNGIGGAGAGAGFETQAMPHAANNDRDNSSPKSESSGSDKTVIGPVRVSFPYLTSVAGDRTVPVETGGHYMADGWGQQLMTLREFLEGYAVATAEAEEASGVDKSESRGSSASSDRLQPSSIDLASSSAVQALHGGSRSLRAKVVIESDNNARDSLSSTTASAASAAFGYLAQHPLFDQIPALRDDVSLPDYCGLLPPRGEGRRPTISREKAQQHSESSSSSSCSSGAGPDSPAYKKRRRLDCGESESASGGEGDEGSGTNHDDDDGSSGGDGGGQVTMNAWLGPCGTVSCLHYDAPHNLLCQVVGVKRVLLVDPRHSARLYPHGGIMGNTSQVDPEADWQPFESHPFPLFPGTPLYAATLLPGQALYIPPHWWHHVRALTQSFSVSLWWGAAAGQ